MGYLISFADFCRLRNEPYGFAGLDRHRKISMKLLKTNVPGGVLQLTNETSPKIDSKYIITDVPGGLVTLDETGKVRPENIPPASGSKYKGIFNSEAELVVAYPSAVHGDYAYVEGEGYYWWNPKLMIDGVLAPQWVRELISYDDYSTLNDDAKLAVNYILKV